DEAAGRLEARLLLRIGLLSLLLLQLLDEDVAALGQVALELGDAGKLLDVEQALVDGARVVGRLLLHGLEQQQLGHLRHSALLFALALCALARAGPGAGAAAELLVLPAVEIAQGL